MSSPPEALIDLTPRGKSIGATIDAINARTTTSRSPEGPPSLLSHLALRPAWLRSWPRDDRQPLTEFVGTGPYRFVERKPTNTPCSSATRLCRAERSAERLCRQREAKLAGLRFIPVPTPTPRRGRDCRARSRPASSPVREKVSGASGVQPILTMPYGFPMW